MTTIKYNFDSLKKANVADDKIKATLSQSFHVDAFGRGYHIDYTIFEDASRKRKIGSYKLDLVEPGSIELNSGTSRTSVHKITLEKIVADAAKAHGGKVAEEIKK